MDNFSQVITQCLVIAMSLILLVHLVAIAIYKEVIIKEPMVPVLVFEIVIMVVIMAFGIYNVIVLIKGG